MLALSAFAKQGMAAIEPLVPRTKIEAPASLFASRTTRDWMHCFAGCQSRTWLVRIGLTVSDLIPDRPSYYFYMKAATSQAT